MASLSESLGLRGGGQGGGLISIVGAGGKTTLMFRLAHELAAAGDTVLTTTTTKILMPREEQSAKVIISPHIEKVIQEAISILSEHRHLSAAASYIASQDKLDGFAASDVVKIQDSGLFRWILVEADGAKHRPLKAPAAHEPVIPLSSRWVIAVVGLDAVGQPLTEEWVFRSRLFADLTGTKPGAPVTELALAKALTHEAGIMKGSPPGALKCIFLNKAETKERIEAGRRVTGFLRKAGGIQMDRAVIGSLHSEGPLEGYDLRNKGTKAQRHKVTR